MRTLVVSDLHLGRPRHAVLEREPPRERLLAALDGVQRLVLLGDVIEMLVRPPEQSMRVAAPVLRAIGERLGSETEVVFVPGNHDRALIERWLSAHRDTLGVDTGVPPDASPELAQVIRWLEPARTRVHYPGVWLSKDMWATHGHYLDRHLLPDSSYGVTRGLLGRTPQHDTTPQEYEREGGSRLGRLETLLPSPLRAPMRQALGLARAATMPAGPTNLITPRWAPVTAPLLSFQMQHASIPAITHVTQRLGVNAGCLIFGHVHRLGPLPDDDPKDWTSPTGTTRVFNPGSWLYEPLLLHRASSPHPYWPGGALVIEDDEAPRPVGLLDDLGPEALHGSRAGRRRVRR